MREAALPQGKDHTRAAPAAEQLSPSPRGTRALPGQVLLFMCIYSVLRHV